jgi:inhibitor of KinA sporulation pathway (predicted exonuclease)
MRQARTGCDALAASAGAGAASPRPGGREARLDLAARSAAALAARGGPAGAARRARGRGRRLPAAPSRGKQAAVREAELYLVVDLEATCDDRGRIPREETEIIEIGAVLVDGETLVPVGELQTFVRPVVHPRLTDFCTRLTTIGQDEVDRAPLFPEAAARLAEFGEGGALFCSWGAYDRNQLERDASRHRIAPPLGPDHWNLKQAFAAATGCRPCGTAEALRRAGLPPRGTAHRGIDDARNIARLLPWVLGRGAQEVAPRDAVPRSRGDRRGGKSRSRR